MGFIRDNFLQDTSYGIKTSVGLGSYMTSLRLRGKALECEMRRIKVGYSGFSLDLAPVVIRHFVSKMIKMHSNT